MSYAPPDSMLDASWVGARLRGHSQEVLHGYFAGGDHITPAGWLSMRFGAAHVSKQQFADPAGWDSFAHTPLIVSRDTEYVPPYNVVVATWASAEEYTPVIGELDATWTTEEKVPQYVTPEGWFSESFGELAARWPQYINGAGGFDVLAIGRAAVNPPPLNASWHGAHPYSPADTTQYGHWGWGGPGHICTYGQSYARLGDGTNVWSHTTRVDGAGAIPPVHEYGTPMVWLYTRFLVPVGVTVPVQGTQWVSHWLRYITAAGGAEALANGLQWASHSPRTLEPKGVPAPEVMESHQIGGTRYLLVEGTDMTRWGARIIPEGQNIYPMGFAGEVGTLGIEHFKRYLLASGFQTYADDLRFPFHHAWNLRQYIQQVYDPNDDLNPQPFGKWTAAENRNKEPVPVGWLSERIGYQFIWNKASPMLPPGIAPPADQVGGRDLSATHWLRNLPLEGIDSFTSERWHAVFNAADPLLPSGTDMLAVGAHTLENRSREFKQIGGMDAAEVGTPMVSYAIRGLLVEERHSIEPPQIDLPEVKQYTRYLEYVSVGDKSGAGMPVLEIRWTIITPRWTFHPPAFIGEPALRNVTPELPVAGVNHEEFGDTHIRTEWRRVETREGDMVRWGRPIVRDRRSWVEFVTLGAPPSLLPGPVVTKRGGLPEQRTIAPGGIDVPEGGRQVPPPMMSLRTIELDRPFDSQTFGRPTVHANGMRVEPGYSEYLMGHPTVTAKNRVLKVAPWPDDKVYDPSPARISPHTLYTGFAASEQAIRNHEPMDLHNVGDRDLPRAGFGNYAYVAHHHRRIWPRSFPLPGIDLNVPDPVVEHTRFYIEPIGARTTDFGIPSVPNTQVIEFVEEDTLFSQEMGTPTVDWPPYVGPLSVFPAGVVAPTISKPLVEFYHRSISPAGWPSMAMGTKLLNDDPYPWRGLRIGPRVPMMIEGILGEGFGNTRIDLFIRGISVPGFDPFACTYEFDKFDQRMRVKGTPRPRPPTQALGVAGIAPTGHGTPDAKLAVHYIRPDGNAEQYRKGAPQ